MGEIYSSSGPSDEEIRELQEMARKAVTSAPSIGEIIPQQVEESRQLQELIEEKRLYLREDAEGDN